MPVYRVTTRTKLRNGNFCHMQHEPTRADNRKQAETTAQSLATAHAEKAHGFDMHPMQVEVVEIVELIGVGQ